MAQTATPAKKEGCKVAATLGDKWMILVFPFIPLALFTIALIGFWVAATYIIPMFM